MNACTPEVQVDCYLFETFLNREAKWCKTSSEHLNTQNTAAASFRSHAWLDLASYFCSTLYQVGKMNTSKTERIFQSASIFLLLLK